ncbi:MAG: class I SAM-dependent rRNA methyltransferase [Myxococcales bacterium]|nr:class I SAM-dependent rRNA methyltransferase [Myxococcales bacterium]
MPAVSVPERLVGHLLAGHPWLSAGAVPAIDDASTGDFVALLTPKRRILGIALFDGHSPIALRVLSTRADERPGRELWRARIRDALALREAALDLRETDAFRLIHGEGDRLPGVVVDAYAGHLSLKLDTAAWLPHIGGLVDALVDVVAPRGIYLKGVSGQRRRSERGAVELGPEAEPRTLYGAPPPEPTIVREHGMRLGVSLVHGQKTGFFLDQRENRALIRRFGAGREVLNLFSYTGGFSLAAALGGATRVTSVDTASAAIAGARDNFALNDLDPKAHEFVVDDAFVFIDRCAAQERTFDLVICDPPSFAPRRQAVTKALRAYTRLHTQALRRVRRRGLFAAASCSSHITMEMFLGTLREAAARQKRPLRILECRQEPADHPSFLHFPEGRYLKFVLMAAD